MLIVFSWITVVISVAGSEPASGSSGSSGSTPESGSEPVPSSIITGVPSTTDNVWLPIIFGT